MAVETLNGVIGGDSWENRNGHSVGGGDVGDGVGINGSGRGKSGYHEGMGNGKPRGWQGRLITGGLTGRSAGLSRNNKPWTNRYNDIQLADQRLTRPDVSRATQYKSLPMVQPVFGSTRPYPARCCNCLPESKNAQFTLTLTQAGLKNILEVPTKYGDNPWLCKRFFHVSFVMQRILPVTYTDVTEAVLKSSRLAEAIQKVVEEQSDESTTDEELARIKSREGRKAKAILKRMSARISNLLVRFTGWFLHKLLTRLLSSIVIHKGQIELIKQVSKRRLPLIFLPTHRSHLDYILMTFTVFNYDIRAPHVAAGDNLLIPLFGSLMRGLGGFFIRRKLDKVSGKKDHVYRAILHTYMEELLRNDEYLEFFIEGGRTRSGKAIYPKGGLLSVLVDAYNTGVIPDAYLIPISISYDKLVDGNFNKEQMGEPKANETFWRAILGIYRVFMGSFGSVRIDFSQPFSLREFLKVSKLYPRVEDGDDCILNRSDSSSLNGGTNVLKASSSSYTMDLVNSSDMRNTVQSLAEHVVFEQAKVMSISAVQILSALFLFQYREGATQREIHSTFEFIKNEVLLRNRDVGFSGDTPDVVKFAGGLLGPSLIRVEGERLTPTTSLPLVFELSYYANVVASVFATESLVASAIYAMVERGQWMNGTTCIQVSMKEVLLEAAELCDIFKYEFIFVPPCLTTDQVILEAFDKFRNTNILIPVEEKENENGVTAEDKQWVKRFAATLDDEDEIWNEADQTYEVNRSEETWQKFWFLKRILSPFIETYYVSAAYLIQLLDTDLPESDFIAMVHKSLKERVSSGATKYGESAALDTIRLSVKGFEHVKVLNRYQTANISMISLTEEYQDQSVLERFVQRLESLRD